MNFYALTGLINCISATLFGLLVFLKDHKKRLNQIFALMTLSIVIWSFSYWRWLVAVDKPDAFFWVKMLSIGSTLIPIFYLHWILVLLEIEKYKKKVLILGYLITIIFLSFNFSPLFIKDVQPILSFAWWPKPGLLYHFYLLFDYIGLIGYGLYQLIKNYRIKVGYQRAQIKYVIRGTVIGFGGGATNFPLWYNIPFPPIGNILVAFYPLILTYTILKYRLMDIRMTIKRSSLFSVVVMGVAMVYVSVAFLLSVLVFGGELTGLKQLIITGLVVGGIVAVGFRPLYNFLQNVTDKFFFKGEYNPQELIRNITSQLATALEVKEISNVLKKNIGKKMRIKRVRLVITNSELFPKKRERFHKKASIRGLISYLQENKETLVLEELARYYREHSEKYDKRHLAYKDLKRLNEAVVLPVYVRSETEGGAGINETSLRRSIATEKLAAFIFLGSKKSGDAFTTEDINTLEIIASQVGVALENAFMYEKIKNFSVILEKEVKRQTKELREANLRLRQLDKAKSEFISIASHQLRTPLTAIKGLISMALEGFWGPLNSEQKKYLSQAYQSGERLLKLIEDLLDISRIEAGRLEFNFRTIDLTKIVKEVINELAPSARKKKLYLRFIKPKKPLPKVKADSNKIREVIENLVDNALHYTAKGGATIRLKYNKTKNKVIFSIADTGIGIPKTLQSSLFTKFHRSKKAVSRYTEGTGLGLFVALKIIEAHHGRIWVKSEGEGKGSTFYFELDAKKDKRHKNKR